MQLSKSHKSIKFDFIKKVTLRNYLHLEGNKCFPNCLLDKNEALKIFNSSLQADKGLFKPETLEEVHS